MHSTGTKSTTTKCPGDTTGIRKKHPGEPLPAARLASWLLVSLILCCVPLYVSAQQQKDFVVNYELEDRLNKHFSNYFDPATYFISVRSTVAYSETGKAELRSPESARLPGIPVVLSNVEQVRRQQMSTMGFPTTTGLMNILDNDIIIFADISHSKENLEFMQILATYAIPFVEDRGDQIRIVQQTFPPRAIKKDHLIFELADPLPDPQNIRLMMPDDDSMVRNQVTVQHYIWITAGMFVALLLFMVLLFYIFYRKIMDTLGVKKKMQEQGPGNYEQYFDKK